MVSLPRDGDLEDYSQSAAKTPFVSKKFPVFSDPTWTAYFHFLLVERKRVSVHVSELLNSGTLSPLPLLPGLSSAFSLDGHTSPPLSPPPLLPPLRLRGTADVTDPCSLRGGSSAAIASGSSHPCYPGVQSTAPWCPFQISPQVPQLKIDRQFQVEKSEKSQRLFKQID